MIGAFRVFSAWLSLSLWLWLSAAAYTWPQMSTVAHDASDAVFLWPMGMRAVFRPTPPIGWSMSQGFKSKTVSKAGAAQKPTALKRGARVINPKKASAVQAFQLRKKLTSEHVKLTEMQTAGRMVGPSGKANLTLVKPASGTDSKSGKGKKRQ